MNARILKETRTQLPVFILMLFGMGMAVGFQWRYGDGEDNILYLISSIYVIGSILMAAQAFGNEYQHRTLSLLMSQPIARGKLWREKMIVVLAFGILTFFIIIAGMILHNHFTLGEINLLFYLTCMVLIPIGFAATTPYLTLISKSTIGGAVFAFFCPAMLLAFGNALWNWLSKLGFNDAITKRFPWLHWGDDFWLLIPAILYVAPLYWFGYRKFLRLQVVDSHSQEISLPAAFETPFEKLSSLFSGARAKLLLKELRVQRTSLLVSAGFCALAAIALLARWFNPETQGDYLAGLTVLYMVFFPVIVGVTAVAEEKAWGLAEWHLTLPLSAQRQWRAKSLVALVIGLVLGVVLPFAFICLGPWHEEFPSWLQMLGFIPHILLLTALSMYAASVSRSAIRALLLALGLLIAILAIGASATANEGTSPVSLLNQMFNETVLGWVDRYVYPMLWNLIVLPAWALSGSQATAQAVAHWADRSANNHLHVIFEALGASGCIWIVLRLALAHYRRSDLQHRCLVIQLIAIAVLARLMGTVFFAM